jgi:hypothetical protein
MFSRVFIELLFMYKRLHDYSNKLISSNTNVHKDIIEFNLNKINEDIKLREIYDEFIIYYEKSILTYFTKK